MSHISHTTVSYDPVSQMFPAAPVGPFILTFDTVTLTNHLSVSYTKCKYRDGEVRRSDYTLVITLIFSDTEGKVTHVKRAMNANKPGECIEVRVSSNSVCLRSFLGKTVHCVMDIVCIGNAEITTGAVDAMETSAPPEALEALEALYDLEIMCADGEIVNAYKILLARCSPVFTAMFTSPGFRHVDRITISDADSTFVKRMVGIASGVNNRGVSDTDFELVALCDQYGISGVVDAWEVEARMKLRAESVVSVMRLATMVNKMGLAKHAMRFIKSKQSVRFINDLTKEEMVQILSV